MTEAYPLQWPEGWPRTALDQRDKGYQFKERDNRATTSWVQTKPVSFPTARDKLYTELQRLGASHVVVSTNHQPDKYGIPTERSRVQDHGVAVYFQYHGKAMAMACDRFDGAAANMRSLGLAIEAMRQLERHGGGQMMERAFAGFAALPAPGAARQWWDVLEVRRDASIEVIRANYRRLAVDHHPDKGGAPGRMSEINAAWDQAQREKEAA